MDYQHKTVLRHEAVEQLRVQPHGVYCDVTLGGGGHAQAILDQLADTGTLVCLDRDEAALEHARRNLRPGHTKLVLQRGHFGDLVQILQSLGIGLVNGLVADLGISSHQVDSAGRGFSFNQRGPLDMRMDQSGGVTVAELIDQLDATQLADLIYQLGEETQSRQIARAIKQKYLEGTLTDTLALAAVVAQAIHRKGGTRIHPATKTFMALRMAVNDELGQLHKLLQSFLHVVAPAGRVAIITFHSLEDRMVKQYFEQLARSCVCPPGLPVCICNHKPQVRVLTRKAIKPSSAELAENSRARSAKLRAVEVLRA